MLSRLASTASAVGLGSKIVTLEIDIVGACERLLVDGQHRTVAPVPGESWSACAMPGTASAR